jgi:hypothetical protein
MLDDLGPTERGDWSGWYEHNVSLAEAFKTSLREETGWP